MINTTIPTNLDFPNRGVLERDDFVNAQEAAQDFLAGAYTTALNQYATELNDTEADINLKWEQVQNQAVVGSYSQAYIDATFTPKILNTQTEKSTPIDADLIPLSDSALSFGLKKLSWANLKATLISSFGNLISELTEKATPANADMIVIADSASSNASKKLTLANLKNYTSPASSETVAGIIELATTAEAQAGTDNTRAITPLKLRNALNATGTAPIFVCRTWVNFNGTGTVAIRASGNISSITDNGVGDYTINFTTAMSDVNYSFLGYARDSDADGIGLIVSSALNQSKSTSSMGITSFYSAKTDSPEINIAVFR